MGWPATRYKSQQGPLLHHSHSLSSEVHDASREVQYQLEHNLVRSHITLRVANPMEHINQVHGQKAPITALFPRLESMLHTLFNSPACQDCRHDGNSQIDTEG